MWRSSMEPDVVEIAPSLAWSSKKRKQKQVIVSEVIDVERHEIRNAGGSSLDVNVEEATGTATNPSGPLNIIESDPSTSPESHDMLLDPDSLIFEDDYDYYDQYVQYSDEAMDDDHYLMYQDLLDSKDIPIDVEMAIPWFQNSAKEETSKSGGSRSSYADSGKEKSVVSNKSQEMTNASGSPSLFSSPQMSVSASQPGSVVSLNSKGSKSLTTVLPQYTPFDYSSTCSPQKYHSGSKSRISFSSVSSNGGFADSLPVMPPHTPATVGAHTSDTVLLVSPNPPNPHVSLSSLPRGRKHGKSWAKRIQEEWNILENGLPDTIFVRAYESRMDLLRAVIIGAEGTPYHDGLFFFDIYFPDTYPNTPPLVHYRGRGLEINPNLHVTGTVCLSLLGTWSGHATENWIPNVSTMLQVLVSIQALILTKDPYFNEPAIEGGRGSSWFEAKSKAYNERIFILSLRTMINNMTFPPKYFGDFVYGHFFSRAHDILKACRAYMDGVPVGSLVNGTVKRTGVSIPFEFRSSLNSCMKFLVIEFALLGVKGLDEATGSNNNNNNQAETEESDKVKIKRIRISRWT